jgi:enoyl-CoA hydratase/carnithine racemase
MTTGHETIQLRLEHRTAWITFNRPPLNDGDFAAQLEEAERVYLFELMQTRDAREGTLALLEKRPPIWKGK